MEGTPVQFASTRWSLVNAASLGKGSPARAALGELCVLYWAPVYGYLRRKGFDPEDAADLTQGFVAELLERGHLGAPEQERGRFRFYLLGALEHYVSRVRQKERALKRGGGVPPLSLDFNWAEGQVPLDAVDHRTPEAAFHRQWALTLLATATNALEERYRADGKQELFAALRSVLDGELPAESYREIGERLAMSEDAVKMAATRLRRRFREELRARIADTVLTDAEIDDELRGLIEAVQ